MPKINTTRRDILRKIANVSLVGSGATAALAKLNLMDAFANQTGEYRALVCLFLYGGNDSYNMVVPTDREAYSQYAKSRENLALNSGQLLPLTASTNLGQKFALHPSMPELQKLANDGSVAVIGNVGTLISPTTKNQYDSKSTAIPANLFSHNSQANFWQSLQDDDRNPKGWAGRMADAMHESANLNSVLSMNISLSGNNLLQSGLNSSPYFVASGGIPLISGLNKTRQAVAEQERIRIFESLMKTEQQHIFAQTFADIKSRAVDLGGVVGRELNTLDEFETEKPAGNKVANDLESVAKLIKLRGKFDMTRQIYFVGIGGWDTHSDLLEKHTILLSNLSSAMRYFHDLTVEMNLSKQVTTFTAADFGRTLSSNGSGSDHGWSGHQLVMGGAVNGSKIYGSMPDFVLGGNHDVGRGRLIPTTSVDQYAATLSRWFGLSQSDANEIFPNLPNFETANLGFLNA